MVILGGHDLQWVRRIDVAIHNHAAYMRAGDKFRRLREDLDSAYMSRNSRLCGREIKPERCSGAVLLVKRLERLTDKGNGL